MKLKICIVVGKYYQDAANDLIKGATLILNKYNKSSQKKKEIDYIYGTGISGFKKYTGTLNFENSGTGARSFLGILTCFPYKVTITGDASLKLRPFKRLTTYLENIGASIAHPKNKKHSLPIKIYGTKDWALAQKHYIKIPSAQIATALIYSALQSKGITEIIETLL